MFINKLNILFFSFLFVLFCMGHYNPSKWFVGFLLVHVAISNFLTILHQKNYNNLKELIGDKDGN